VEILSWLLMADRDIRTAETYQGMVLLLETSEGLPSATKVFRILRNMGERGLLRQFSAVLFARAKAWSFQQQNNTAEKTAYTEEQRKAVLQALSAYAPEAMAVFNVDFGHADPQLVIPYGGRVRIDGPARRITVTY
jgi:muramoyltetrapeptide carboxypeptidase LdcA involved in peptidoglycan recycling